MNKLKIIVSVLTFIYAFFIFTYPPSFYNDDSLFLANGIDYYSIIDFSPHFPGYPFVIILGKLVNIFVNDSIYSLFLISASCAILLPSILFLYIKRLLDEKIAFVVFLLSLTSPYLMNLSLSMLSDSIGLFFLFLGLYLLELNKTKSSGIVLAISLFSRPSYLIFFLIGLIYLYFVKKNQLKDVFIYFLLTSIFFLLFIFINNGILFVYEAKRFIVGHFSLWGTGQNTRTSWTDNFLSLVNLPYIFLFYTIVKYEKRVFLIYILSFFYLFWIIFAQNPDNIRHMIPLIFLFNILIASYFINKRILLIMILTLNLFTIFSYKEKLSPIDQIIKEIKNEERIVISNRSIEILRKSSNNAVVDKFYSNSADYVSSKNKTFTITTDKPKETIFKTFLGRFVGEHTFYLIKN
jgi:hypothetical protein